MPNKPLLPGFSKAMIKRLKATGYSKKDLVSHTDMQAGAMIADILAEVQEVEQKADSLQKNTIDLINEIWEQD